jgi:hypothetical protein
MSVGSFVVDDLFVYRITKYLSTNPDRKWVNTYEFKATTTGDEGDLLDLGTNIVNFEAAMSLVGVVFDRILISTWEPDSVPYNPEVFISSSLTAAGARVVGSEQVPLTTALSVTRQATSGRFGHLFYRGWLCEGDTNAPAGKAVLVNRPQLQTDVDAALGSSGFDGAIGAGSIGALSLCMVSADGSQSRFVTSLRVQGVTSLPVDHTWFNRTVTP